MEQSWLQHVEEDALLKELPASVAAEIRDLGASGYTPESIGVILLAQADRSSTTRSLSGWSSELWGRLVAEFRMLICTDDARYADLRDKLGKESHLTSAVVLSVVSSAVSARLGIEAGLVTPFIVLLLVSLLRTTKEAWCKQFEEQARV